MSLIPRDVDYAFRALVHMAQHDGQLISTAVLEEELGLPRPFMRKVLQKLESAGVVRSVKGNNGGFCVARPYGDISVGMLIRVLQGGLGFADCKMNKDACPHIKYCPLHKKIGDIEKNVLNELTAIDVASLLKK